MEGGRVRFYLRKRAASEEAEQPETLTGGSYTDLRKQDRATRNQEGGDGRNEYQQNEEVGGGKKMSGGAGGERSEESDSQKGGDEDRSVRPNV